MEESVSGTMIGEERNENTPQAVGSRRTVKTTLRVGSGARTSTRTVPPATSFDA